MSVRKGPNRCTCFDCLCTYYDLTRSRAIHLYTKYLTQPCCVNEQIIYIVHCDIFIRLHAMVSVFFIRPRMAC